MRGIRSNRELKDMIELNGASENIKNFNRTHPAATQSQLNLGIWQLM